MAEHKSQDDSLRIIAALLCDFQTLHSEVFTPRACKLTIQKINNRYAREGMSFLTKTLPRLGKGLDRALSSQDPFDASKLRFESQPNSKLPKLMGELFNRIFDQDGKVLPDPCVASIQAIRQLAYIFYKYKLEYSPDQEQKVLKNFVENEANIAHFNQLFSSIAEETEGQPEHWKRVSPVRWVKLIRRARRYLFEVFKHFDPRDIHPRHGPGAVSTREQLWGKYTWGAISPRLISSYPLDAYFYASLGHICDRVDDLTNHQLEETPARVLLVQKDSRGPRLISCEPLSMMWIQQGLNDAIVKWIEHHPLTKDNVHFTDQQPNQFGALLGSSTGRYATLDLKDASDRVTVGLVRLLFPEPLLECLLNSRSQSTVLPGGEEIKLNKFAPMGSALCFSTLALTIWALLKAGIQDAEARKRFLVYGDDVVVPTAHAAEAICILESVGLAINSDKSCIHGFFRESCGMDAYKGYPVTPVKIKTRWTTHRCPNAYTSWIAYAKQFWSRRYYRLYDFVVQRLVKLYKTIPERPVTHIEYPSLPLVPSNTTRPKERTNYFLQKREYRVLAAVSRPVLKEIDGWKMLLRYFAEASPDCPLPLDAESRSEERVLKAFGFDQKAFSVRLYTRRHASILAWCWR